ncbi:DUF397 domain-containing protein [Streptomyces sp. TS71-3]|uniref:DUF397 domain-containing protein n=1 Tax=Streptomyces sp. TS71-3 TaxID=2733862 RepID=UPI001B22BA8A|nr:DUF397 domain-containing protein [Streptomyces sp. TS71-3]GHJ35415.1 hypothetical protein Sm713_10240 [Streptomyces sp. TS71-3]
MDHSQLAWRKSSYSGNPNNECVECARSRRGRILVRDSKDPGRAMVSFGARAWSEFADAIGAGQLHRSPE